MSSEGKAALRWGIIIMTVVVALILLLFWAWPQYKVYSQRQTGMAELQRSEQNRRVLVEQARAQADAAEFEAAAEIARATGAAEANAILAQSLGGTEGYLRWMYIQMLRDTAGVGNRDIIYLPTEAGIPILEAGRAVGGTE